MREKRSGRDQVESGAAFWLGEGGADGEVNKNGGRGDEKNVHSLTARTHRELLHPNTQHRGFEVARCISFSSLCKWGWGEGWDTVIEETRCSRASKGKREILPLVRKVVLLSCPIYVYNHFE